MNEAPVQNQALGSSLFSASATYPHVSSVRERYARQRVPPFLWRFHPYSSEFRKENEDKIEETRRHLAEEILSTFFGSQDGTYRSSWPTESKESLYPALEQADENDEVFLRFLFDALLISRQFGEARPRLPDWVRYIVGAGIIVLCVVTCTYAGIFFGLDAFLGINEFLWYLYISSSISTVLFAYVCMALSGLLSGFLLRYLTLVSPTVVLMTVFIIVSLTLTIAVFNTIAFLEEDWMKSIVFGFLLGIPAIFFSFIYTMPFGFLTYWLINTAFGKPKKLALIESLFDMRSQCRLFKRWDDNLLMLIAFKLDAATEAVHSLGNPSAWRETAGNNKIDARTCNRLAAEGKRIAARLREVKADVLLGKYRSPQQFSKWLEKQLYAAVTDDIQAIDKAEAEGDDFAKKALIARVRDGGLSIFLGVAPLVVAIAFEAELLELFSVQDKEVWNWVKISFAGWAAVSVLSVLDPNFEKKLGIAKSATGVAADLGFKRRK